MDHEYIKSVCINDANLKRRWVFDSSFYFFLNLSRSCCCCWCSFFSAPPNRIHVWSHDLWVVCGLADSSLDSCGLVECVRTLDFVWSFLIIVICSELCWSGSIDSMEWRWLTRILRMQLSISAIWIMLYSSLLYDFTMDLMLVRVLGISRVPWR